MWHSLTAVAAPPCSFDCCWISLSLVAGCCVSQLGPSHPLGGGRRYFSAGSGLGGRLFTFNSTVAGSSPLIPRLQHTVTGSSPLIPQLPALHIWFHGCNTRVFTFDSTVATHGSSGHAVVWFWMAVRFLPKEAVSVRRFDLENDGSGGVTCESGRFVAQSGECVRTVICLEHWRQRWCAGRMIVRRKSCLWCSRRVWGEWWFDD